MSDIVPDYMTALVGYRAWKLSPEGDLLSINSDTMEPWPCKTKKQAICTVLRDHVAWAPGSTVWSTSAYIPIPQAVAVTFERLWERRTAERKARNHHCPMPNCSCGIYAAKADTSQHFQDYRYGAPVWGEVYLWGKIQEYSGGYRAEFAYPKSLKTRNVKLAPTIAERYGVPCETVAVRASGDVYDLLRQTVGRGVPMTAIQGGRRGDKRSWIDALVRGIQRLAMTGLRCPQCKATDSTVLDSRPVRFWRRRRHQCGACGHRFSTAEIVLTRRLREALWQTRPPSASS